MAAKDNTVLGRIKEARMRWIVRIATHAAAGAIGFALGIYLLPILVAPEGPDLTTLQEQSAGAEYTAELTRDLAGSDFLHWGEGTISLTSDQIVHMGALSPGPDYRAYLTPEFVEDEAQFEAIKAASLQIGKVDTFGGFILDLPDGVDLASYTSVVIWCERFGEFITAGKYR